MIPLVLTKHEFVCQSLRGPFSRPEIFNKMSCVWCTIICTSPVLDQSHFILLTRVANALEPATIAPRKYKQCGRRLITVALSRTVTSNRFFIVRYFKIKTPTNVCQPWKTVGYVNFNTDSTYCKINKGMLNKNAQLNKHQGMCRNSTVC
jgi:hypothetical protein